MPTPKKDATIAELADVFKSAPGMYLADFGGLNSDAMSELRQRCFAASVTFRVVKNTLAEKAAEAAGVPDLSEHLIGETALAYSDDPSAPVKVIQKFVDDVREAKGKPEIKTGLVEGQTMTSNQMDFIAKLESPEIVQAKFLGLLQAPASKFVGLLAAAPSGLARVLDQRRQQLEATEESAG